MKLPEARWHVVAPDAGESGADGWRSGGPPSTRPCPATVAQLQPWRGPKGTTSCKLVRPLPPTRIGHVSVAVAAQVAR